MEDTRETQQHHRHMGSQGLRQHAQGLHGSVPDGVLGLKEKWTQILIPNPEEEKWTRILIPNLEAISTEYHF